MTVQKGKLYGYNLKELAKYKRTKQKQLKQDRTWNFNMKSRLTVVSREAKKKQHARASSGPRDHYSELFTRMAPLKF